MSAHKHTWRIYASDAHLPASKKQWYCRCGDKKQNELPPATLPWGSRRQYAMKPHESRAFAESMADLGARQYVAESVVFDPTSRRT